MYVNIIFRDFVHIFIYPITNSKRNIWISASQTWEKSPIHGFANFSEILYFIISHFWGIFTELSKTWRRLISHLFSFLYLIRFYKWNWRCIKTFYCNYAQNVFLIQCVIVSPTTIWCRNNAKWNTKGSLLPPSLRSTNGHGKMASKDM